MAPNNKIITNKNEKTTTWREYLNKLFGDNNRAAASNSKIIDLGGPSITKAETL